jgi:hypothetical protein
MTYAQVVQYSGSSVLTDVEVQVLSRASQEVIGFMSITFFVVGTGERT